MTKLNVLLEKLAPFVKSIELKGKDNSAFLYVVGNGKSVEISIDGNNYWVEFWGGLNEDATPIKEAAFTHLDLAEKSVREWLD